MTDFSRKCIAAAVVLVLHLPLVLLFVSGQGRAGGSVTAELFPKSNGKHPVTAVALPNLGFVEKLKPTSSTAKQATTKPSSPDEKPKSNNVEHPSQHDQPLRQRRIDSSDPAVSIRNPVEPEPKSIHHMSVAEQEQILTDYRRTCEEGKTQIALRLSKGVRVSELASEYIIKDKTQALAFDRFGNRTQPTGSLQAEVDLFELPFDFRTTLVNHFGLDGAEYYTAFMVLSKRTEIELYRSLFEYLRKQGCQSPRADWIYRAQLSHYPQTFVWSDQRPIPE